MKRAWLIAPLLLIGAPPAALFEEVDLKAAGIDWTHDAGRSTQRYMPESLGPGCAFLDYDRDGRLDIFLVNSGPSAFYQPKRTLSSALYRNNGDGTFTDVTAKAGVSGDVFGMGAAAADYDNDGDPDLYLTAYGQTRLYRNNGDGTFRDIAREAGVLIDGWTTSAVWFDYDNDGRLDLFVCSFIEYGPEAWPLCGKNSAGESFYCIPRVFKPTSSYLFRGNGDGTFSKASSGAAIERSKGKALGAVATDVNNDGLMDLFVANDTVQNFLFMNRGGARGEAKRWEEIALSAEVAYNADGQPRSGMGVDAADIDGDGFDELFVSNVDYEVFSLYRNQGDETFSDDAYRHDVGRSTRLLSGWGLKFFDADKDGALDLFLANGHPDDMIETHKRTVKHEEPLLLFLNRNNRFQDVSNQAGPVFSKRFSARGLAIGDYDNDGGLDVLVGNNNGRPVLVRNRAGQGNHWLGLKLEGRRSNRDAIGARVIWSAAGVRRSRRVGAGGSYLSSHDQRLVVGLGKAKLDWLEIRWPAPSTRVDRYTDLRVDRYIDFVEKP